MHRENWDDLRFVLAVAEQGSVSAAARQLGVNHATVLRRIAAFEERNGNAVFDRNARGYALPRDRDRVIGAARQVESAVLALERLLKGQAQPIEGEVQLTSTDSFCLLILPEIIADMAKATPDLRLTLLCSNAHLDFSRMNADVTVRPAQMLEDSLSGEQAGSLAFAAYAVEGAPQIWLRPDGVLARSVPARWLADTVAPAHIIPGSDSFLVLKELAAMGQGRAILPCFVGDSDRSLKRLPTVMPDMDVPIWVASHADLADTPRIRETRKMLVAGLLDNAARLQGR